MVCFDLREKGTPMAARSAKSDPVLGFLTVVEDAQHGAFGGYLVLNASGRPLEFHCTTPVKPNRAQEILYGPTLRPYLFGEQIGGVLVAKAALTPALVFTDLADVLAVRSHIGPPAALVLAEGESVQDRHESPPAIRLRIDSPHRRSPILTSFRVGPHRLAVAEAFASDRELLAKIMEPLADFDLFEPFGRIREAIEEAGRGSR